MKYYPANISNSKPKKSRFGAFLRGIAFFLVVSFFLTDIAHAAPALDFTPHDILHDPAVLKISPSIAKIDDVYKGVQSRLLVHIQDAHTNLSAQQNLSKVLEELITRYQIKTVFIEGGTKDDSLTFLRPLADRSSRQRVAKKYLAKGELNGAEYLNLSSDLDMRILGVEQASLYKENLSDYAQIVEEREQVLSYIQEIQKRVRQLKRRLFTKQLLAFDDFLEKFEKKEKDFTEYHDALSRLAASYGINLLGSPHFFALRELKTKEEKIDFAKANQEQVRLIASLSSPNGSTSLTTRAFIGDQHRVDSRFRGNDKVEKLKSQSLTPIAFYERLFAEARRNKINPREYPNLLGYVDYLKAYSAIDLKKLLEETKSLEENIFEQSLTNPDALYLHRIDRYLKTLEKLFSLQAQKDDFEDYSQKKKETNFETIVLLAFLNKKLYELEDYSGVLKYLPLVDNNKGKIEDFYRLTEKRDEVFIQKSLDAMNKENLSAAVLITGGYHTPHLKALMRDKGLSYVVVTPNITHETNIPRYEKLLLSQLGSKDHIRKISTTRQESYLGLVAALERPNTPVRAIRAELPRLDKVAARLASQDSNVIQANKDKVLIFDILDRAARRIQNSKTHPWHGKMVYQEESQKRETLLTNMWWIFGPRLILSKSILFRSVVLVQESLTLVDINPERVVGLSEDREKVILQLTYPKFDSPERSYSIDGDANVKVLAGKRRRFLKPTFAARLAPSPNRPAFADQSARGGLLRSGDGVADNASESGYIKYLNGLRKSDLQLLGLDPGKADSYTKRDFIRAFKDLPKEGRKRKAGAHDAWRRLDGSFYLRLKASPSGSASSPSIPIAGLARKVISKELKFDEALGLLVAADPSKTETSRASLRQAIAELQKKSETKRRERLLERAQHGARLALSDPQKGESKGLATDEEIQDLIHRLASPDIIDRRNAAIALGLIGPDAKKAVPALIKVLEYKEKRDTYYNYSNRFAQAEEDNFRSAAAKALGQIGPSAKKAVPVLIEVLKDLEDKYGYHSSSSSAITALGLIGPAAKEAVPALIKVVWDEDIPYNGSAVSTSLGQIGLDWSSDKRLLLRILVVFLKHGDKFHTLFHNLHQQGAYPDIIFNRAITAYARTKGWTGWQSGGILVTSYGILNKPIDLTTIHRRWSDLKHGTQKIPIGTQLKLDQSKQLDSLGFVPATLSNKSAREEKLLVYLKGYTDWLKELKTLKNEGKKIPEGLDFSKIFPLGVDPYGNKAYYLTAWGEVLSCCTQYGQFIQDMKGISGSNILNEAIFESFKRSFVERTKDISGHPQALAQRIKEVLLALKGTQIEEPYSSQELQTLASQNVSLSISKNAAKELHLQIPNYQRSHIPVNNLIELLMFLESEGLVPRGDESQKPLREKPGISLDILKALEEDNLILKDKTNESEAITIDPKNLSQDFRHGANLVLERSAARLASQFEPVPPLIEDLKSPLWEKQGPWTDENRVFHKRYRTDPSSGRYVAFQSDSKGSSWVIEGSAWVPIGKEDLLLKPIKISWWGDSGTLVVETTDDDTRGKISTAIRGLLWKDPILSMDDSGPLTVVFGGQCMKRLGNDPVLSTLFQETKKDPKGLVILSESDSAARLAESLKLKDIFDRLPKESWVEHEGEGTRFVHKKVLKRDGKDTVTIGFSNNHVSRYESWFIEVHTNPKMILTVFFDKGLVEEFGKLAVFMTDSNGSVFERLTIQRPRDPFVDLKIDSDSSKPSLQLVLDAGTIRYLKEVCHFKTWTDNPNNPSWQISGPSAPAAARLAQTEEAPAIHELSAAPILAPMAASIGLAVAAVVSFNCFWFDSNFLPGIALACAVGAVVQFWKALVNITERIVSKYRQKKLKETLAARLSEAHKQVPQRDLTAFISNAAFTNVFYTILVLPMAVLAAGAFLGWVLLFKHNGSRQVLSLLKEVRLSGKNKNRSGSRLANNRGFDTLTKLYTLVKELKNEYRTNDPERMEQQGLSQQEYSEFTSILAQILMRIDKYNGTKRIDKYKDNHAAYFQDHAYLAGGLNVQKRRVDSLLKWFQDKNPAFRNDLERLTAALEETIDEAKKQQLQVETVTQHSFAKFAALKVAENVRQLQKDPKKVVTIVFATGRTMVDFLEALSKENMDWKRIQAFHLDEYKGLPPKDPSSFAFFLQKNLFSKVPLPKLNIHFINGAKPDLEAYKAQLKKWGGPDIVLLGVGSNGHIAFNEPVVRRFEKIQHPKEESEVGYSLFDSTMRQVQLGEETLKANEADYPGIRQNPYAYTLGIREILQARTIYLLAQGGQKADIVKKFLTGPVTPEVPASILQNHRHVVVILDTEAAKLLGSKAKAPSPSAQRRKTSSQEQGSQGARLASENWNLVLISRSENLGMLLVACKIMDGAALKPEDNKPFRDLQVMLDTIGERKIKALLEDADAEPVLWKRIGELLVLDRELSDEETRDFIFASLTSEDEDIVSLYEKIIESKDLESLLALWDSLTESNHVSISEEIQKELLKLFSMGSFKELKRRLRMVGAEPVIGEQIGTLKMEFRKVKAARLAEGQTHLPDGVIEEVVDGIKLKYVLNQPLAKVVRAFLENPSSDMDVFIREMNVVAKGTRYINMTSQRTMAILLDAANLADQKAKERSKIEELNPNSPPAIDQTMQESAANYEKVTQANWYRTNTAYSLRDLAPSLKPDSVVYDSSAGTGAASLYLLEELAKTGKKIDTLVLSDVDFPLARAFLVHAMGLLEPYRAKGVVREIRYFVLKKKPHPEDPSKNVFALSSEIPGLKGKVDHVIFLNAFHVIPPHQVKPTLDGIFEVMKPGADVIIGSGSIDRSSPIYDGTVLIDTLFHKVYEKTLAIINQDPEFENLESKIEALDEDKVKASQKTRERFLPKAPVLVNVRKSLVASHFNEVETKTNFTLLEKEDYRQFIVGVPDYVKLNIPELAGQDDATIRKIVNRAYDEVYNTSIKNTFIMSWTTLRAEKPAALAQSPSTSLGINSVEGARLAEWENPNKQQVAVIGGAGYVGKTKAIMLATDFGHDVMAMDLKEASIEKLSRGDLGGYAPKLGGLLKKGLASGQLHFTTSLEKAIEGREIIFLTLPTPQSHTGEADISYLESAVKGIAQLIKPGEAKILVVKSTAPPRDTANRLKEIAAENLKPEAKIHFAWEPEFLREGKEVDDDRGEAGRVIIGADERRVAEKIENLYKLHNPKYPRKVVPIVLTDLTSAPLVKYAANGFRGWKISFINFISWLTEPMGFDIEDIANEIGTDSRVRRSFLNAGLGFGGSCFPKDFLAFLRIAQKAGTPFGLLLDALAVNDFQWRWFVERSIKEKLDGVEGKTIVILGGAFKPETDDVREARSIKIIEQLLQWGAYIRVFDPAAIPNLKAEGVFGHDKKILYFENPKQMDRIFGPISDLPAASAIVLVTEWDLFRKKIHFAHIKRLFHKWRLPLPVIFDGRNFFDGREITRLGYEYQAIGRGVSARAFAERHFFVPKEKFIKLVREFFLTVRISYINLVAEVAGAYGANIRDVRKGLGLDPVVGEDYLLSGIGWGGHDLASALHHLSSLLLQINPELLLFYWQIRDRIRQEYGFNASTLEEANTRKWPFIDAVREINDRQIKLYFEKIKQAAGGYLNGKKVAVLGLSYKAGIYSIEGSRSLLLIQELLKEGAIVRATDPEEQAVINASRHLSPNGKISYHTSVSEALKGTEVQVLVTEWEEYRDWKKLFYDEAGRLIPSALNIVDGRHFYDPVELAERGIPYFAVGLNQQLLVSSTNHAATPNGKGPHAARLSETPAFIEADVNGQYQLKDDRDVIVIVEDAALILGFYKGCLEDMSAFQFLIATNLKNARNAVQAVPSGRLKLVITDMDYPVDQRDKESKGSGFRLIDFVRRSPETAKVPILIASGNGIKDIKEEIEKKFPDPEVRGLIDHLEKPVLPVAFLEKITAALNHKPVSARLAEEPTRGNRFSTESVQAADFIIRAYNQYIGEFWKLARVSPERFKKHEYAKGVDEATHRIEMYPQHLDQISARVKELLKTSSADQSLWDNEIRQVYKRRLNGRYDSDLAIYFFESVMRRLDLRTEYQEGDVVKETTVNVQPDKDLYRVYPNPERVSAALVKQMIKDVGFEASDRDVQAAAQRIQNNLGAGALRMPEIQEVQILRFVFYRNKGAYVVGRILSEGRVIPIVFALLNENVPVDHANEIQIDAVLTSEEDVGKVFSYTRSSFHVDAERVYREMADFLNTLMPFKDRASVYSSIGFIQPAKIELIRTLREHLKTEKGIAEFKATLGEKGQVMVTFRLSGLPYVFKAISEKTTKETLREEYELENYEVSSRARSDKEVLAVVSEKYDIVHKHDRFGKMLDAMTYHDLAFPKQSFPSELLKEFRERLPDTLYETPDSIVFKKLYAQRKVVPLKVSLAYLMINKVFEEVNDLNLKKDFILRSIHELRSDDKEYLKDLDTRIEQTGDLDEALSILKKEAGQIFQEIIEDNIHLQNINQLLQKTRDSGQRIVILEREIEKLIKDFGQTIKDLAAAGIWVGDIKTKNYGVTDYGRVVSYDYDELELLKDMKLDQFFEGDPGDDMVHGDMGWGSSPYWVGKMVHGKIYLIELLHRMQLPRDPLNPRKYFDLFGKYHSDLFTNAFWKDRIEKLQRGEIQSSNPYDDDKRLLHVNAARLSGVVFGDSNRGSRSYFLDGETLYAKLRVNTLLAIDLNSRRLDTRKFDNGILHKERVILGRPFVLLKDNNTLYVAGGSSNNILAFDLRTGQLDTTKFDHGIFLGSFLKRPAALYKDGDTLYVAAENSDTVIAIDLKSGQLDETKFNRGVLRLEDLKGPTALEKIDNTLYIAGRYSDTIVAVDLKTGELDHTKFSQTGIFKDEGVLRAPLSLQKFGKTLYVVGYNSNTIIAIDHELGSIDTTKFSEGVFRHGLLDGPADIQLFADTLYVTFSRNGKLFAINAVTGQLDLTKFSQGIAEDKQAVGPSILLKEEKGVLYSISDHVEQPPRVASKYRYQLIETNSATGHREIAPIEIDLEAKSAARLARHRQPDDFGIDKPVRVNSPEGQKLIRSTIRAIRQKRLDRNVAIGRLFAVLLGLNLEQVERLVDQRLQEAAPKRKAARLATVHPEELKVMGSRLALSQRGSKEPATIPILLAGFLMAVFEFSPLPEAHANEVSFDVRIGGQVQLQNQRVNLSDVQKELAASRLSLAETLATSTPAVPIFGETFDAMTAITEIVGNRPILGQMPGWADRGRAANFWKAVLKNLADGSQILFSFPLEAHTQAVDLRETIGLLDKIAKAKGATIYIYPTYQAGKLNPMDLEKLENLSTPRIVVRAKPVLPGQKAMEGLLAGARSELDLHRLNYLVVGADLSQIQNQEDVLGYQALQQSPILPEKLKSNMHLFAFETPQVEQPLFSANDFVSAGFASVFQDLALRTQHRFQWLQTRLGWIPVVKAIVDSQIVNELTSKQAEHFA